MPQIKDSLVDFNPWWKGDYEVEFKHRLVYDKVKKFMPLKQMIAFTGLRRVGKTTLMLKIVEDFIRKDSDRLKAMFFSFDEFKDVEIRDVIEQYVEMSGKDIKKEKLLFLFDEIQKVDNWENQLKSIYDLYGKNIKIVISGSESLFIKMKSKETLAGRMFEFKIEQLTFKEFLDFKEIDLKPKEIYRKELFNLFNEFILTQGFPEMIGVKEKEIIKKYVLESIVQRVIYKDMALMFNVRDVSVLESILKIFMENPGQIIEISNLASQLGVSRQVLSNYLSYLEESFLIRKIYNFSKNTRKVERKLKKYYPVIISPDLLFKEDDVSKSKIFEWFLVNQMNAEFFWRDVYKNEVDVVLSNGKIEPIEIKYGGLDFKGLIAFMKKFSVKNGKIVSFKKEE